MSMRLWSVDCVRLEPPPARGGFPGLQPFPPRLPLPPLHPRLLC
jgi:hypothetical protein